MEATGRRVKLPGVTVADFREGKIKSYRTYFDDVSLIEQIIDILRASTNMEFESRGSTGTTLDIELLGGPDASRGVHCHGAR